MLLRKLLKTHKFAYFYRNYSSPNILKLKERGMFQDIFPDDSA